MSKPGQRDHSTLAQKVALRRVMLRQLGQEPVVLETHGGTGRVYLACYRDVLSGIVIDNDAKKAELLARQRPTWAVYEAACERVLEGGAGAHLLVNVLDLDPFGEPWSALRAFFRSDRPRAERLFVVVNDGLRHRLRLTAWDVEVMQAAVAEWGNELEPIYLEVARWMLAKHAGEAGYRLARFYGYYCGKGQAMTHYLAELLRDSNGRASKAVRR